MSSAIQQIRPVIECFCQILSLYGFSPITPEIFRLAKFNRDEATEPMWRLLYELLHFDRGQIHHERFNQTAKNELVESMKNDLFIRGYMNEEFFRLDEQMKSGSRQLLLCLAWLIYQMRLMEILMENLLKSDSIFDYDDTSALYQSESKMSSKSSNQLEEKNLIGQVKQAMHVNAKFRFGLRRLHGLVIENAHLQHQIHQCHNMSSLDAYLCHHPHLLNHYMIELDLEYRRLNLFVFWNENESIFWKWMESVLDQIPPSEVEDDGKEEERVSHSFTSSDSQRFDLEKKKFNSAIETLDNALNRLEQLWMNSVKSSSSPRENQWSNAVKSIDEEISSLFHQLLTESSSMKSETKSIDEEFFLHQPRRLVYAKATEKVDEQEEQIEEERKDLQNLQIKIDQHIEEQRTILDTLSHQFDHVMIV